jgi:spore coat-associated protein N
MDTTRSTRRRRHVGALAAVGLAVVSITAGATSLALFTSTASADANAFSTGTVTIGTTPTTALVTLAGMAPGDQVTAPITVSNSGTLALRYSVSSSATNADVPTPKGLKDQLVMTVRSGVTTCTNAAYAADGTQLYSGDLDSAAGKLVGDPASGNDSGDRALAASTSEVLCFHVGLPSGSGNGFQNAATTATLTFDAEQTKNN